MTGSRVRGLSSALNADEPLRRQDVNIGKRIYKNSSVSGNVEVDWALYDEVRFLLTGDVTLTFSGAIDGQGCIIKFKQDAIGNHVVTFPSNIRYSMDMRSFSVTAAANKIDRVGFMYDADDFKYDFISAVRNLV